MTHRALHLVEHFLYFDEEAQAEGAARAAVALGFSTEVRPSNTRWLLIARKSTSTAIIAVDADSTNLEDLARSFGGLYDGLERSTRRIAAPTPRPS